MGEYILHSTSSAMVGPLHFNFLTKFAKSHLAEFQYSFPLGKLTQ